jgi:hypothetical protein
VAEKKMPGETEIGRVMAVDTAQLTIELNAELKALTRSTYEGVEEVGRINSYLILPVGARRIVAMVTKVFLTEEAELGQGKAFVTLPSARRLMKATMIGTIEGNEFHQGISLFPVLDNPVLLTTKADLDLIFGCAGNGEHVCPSDPTKPSYCVRIGTSAIFGDYPIQVNPDAFFGKHAAVIGSTGSGKSCTIAAILQSILQLPEVKQTRFIILDTNGEYRSAFQREKDGAWSDAHEDYKCLYIPTDPLKPAQRLVIPYWFMDLDDFSRMFRASPAVQRPVLQEALGLARSAELQRSLVTALRAELVSEFNRVLSFTRGSATSDARQIRQLCDQAVAFLSAEKPALDSLCATCPNLTSRAVIQTFTDVREIARRNIRNEGQQFESYEAIGLQKRGEIDKKISPVIGCLVSYTHQPQESSDSVSVDSPRFFSKEKFLQVHLDRAMVSQEGVARGFARTPRRCSCASLD